LVNPVNGLLVSTSHQDSLTQKFGRLFGVCLDIEGKFKSIDIFCFLI